MVSLACIFTIHSVESKRQEDQLNILFDSKTTALQRATDELVALVKSVGAFMVNANTPTIDQYNSYLKQHTDIGSGIRSVSWAPKIATDELLSYSRMVRHDEDFSYYVFPKEQHSLDCLVPVDESLSYPIRYVSPVFEGSDIKGQRVESICENRVAIASAVKSKDLIAVSYFNEHQLGIRLLYAVKDDNNVVSGMISTELQLHEFLSEAWSEVINSDYIEIQVETQKDNQTLPIFTSHLNTQLVGSKTLKQSGKVHLNKIDQTWTVTVSIARDTRGDWIYGTTAAFFVFLITLFAHFAVKIYSARLANSHSLIREKTKSLAELAVMDNLTMLHNRHALNTHINRYLRRLEEDDRKTFAILFVDLDRFKIINDSMGHMVGDQLLQEVANRLRKHSRFQDRCYRFGGDEFIICVTEFQSEQEVLNIATSYVNQLSEPYYIDGRACHIGASIGVTMVADASYSLSQIMREADTAMYCAKQGDDGKVVFFDHEMFAKSKQRFLLEQAITHALEDNQLHLAYQPIYDSYNEEIIAVEVLIRWQHPDLGFVSPADFIPVAEETGHILPIGDWVVQETCKAISQLIARKPKAKLPRFNINVSARQFAHRHIVNSLENHLAYSGIPAELVGIEITESALLRDSSDTLRHLNDIRKLGVSVSLDDFGTGYSSLSMLNNFPIDVVKMDRSFVQDIEHLGDRPTQLCAAIISMAHTIDMKVVAEGVETQQQLELLKQLNCDKIQGYLLAKPLPFEALQGKIEREVPRYQPVDETSKIEMEHA